MKPSISKLFAVCLAVTSSNALAQIYTVQSQSLAYAPIVGGTTVALTARSSFTANDEGFANIPLGFTFPYYGQNYTTVHVDSNGFLLFGGSTACDTNFICYSGGGIPDATRDNGDFPPITFHSVIAPWWEDLSGTGSIKSKQSAGQIEIEYSGWGPYGGGATFSVKVTLTASGLFQIHYGSITGTTSGATAGWENQTGTAGGNHLGCSATAANCSNLNWPANTLFTIGQPIQPDIVVTAVNIANLTGGGAQNISVNVTPTFQNYGQNPTGATPFGWKAYLSTDRTLGAGDILIYTAPSTLTLTGAGSAGATATDTGLATTTTPPPLGQYYVLVEADPAPGVVTEASETNNVGSTSNYFVSGLDLVATGISGPANSGPGNPMVVNAKWFNQGTDPAGTVNFRVLLSLDAVVSTTDFTLYSGSKTITGGQTVDEMITFNVPANVPGGDFFYLLQIDPGNTVAEANELNNSVASTGKVTMKQADLVNSGTDFLDPITAAPTRIGYFGQPARVSVKVDNIGGANGNNFKIGVVVSTDATLSLLSDTIAVEKDVVLVAQGTSVNVDIPFTMPLKDRNGVNFPTGNYYVFAIVDSTSQVTELNEANNNRAVSGTIQLRAPAPDLTVTRVEAAASGAVGEILPVLRTLKNIGNVDAPPVKYRYFASANPIITPEDVPLQIISGGNSAIEGTITLAIGATDTQTELVKLPASMPAGTYYLGVIIDSGGAVNETDEQNNALASNTVAIAASSLRVSTQQLPDAVVDRPYSYRLVALGEQTGTSTWAVDPSQGTLPMGMTLATDGLLTGTPPAPLVSGFTVIVTNNGRDAQAHLVLRVLPTTTEVEITTTALPAVVKTPTLKYEFSLGAAGGVKPYEWKIVTGTLPRSLTLTNNGIITGFPASDVAEGASNVTLQVRDSLGTTAQKSLSIRVIAPGSLVFRNLELSSGLVGESYFTDIAIQNADLSVITAMQKPLTWARVGELPDGLVLNPTGDVAVIEGKPLRAGNFTFSLSVEDAKGRNDTAQFMIRISPARFKLASVGQPELIRPGDGVAFNITATTQASPKFTIYSGKLAPGLALAADGKISGTVPVENAEGTYNFVIEAKDETGATGLGAFTLEVKREIKAVGCSSTGGSSPIWMLAVLLSLAVCRRFAIPLRRHSLAAVAAVVLSVVPTFARAQTYQISGPNPVTYTAITGGTPIASATAIAIPFPFSYAGQAVSSVQMSTYGYLLIAGYAFASTNLGIPLAITGSFEPVTYLAPWWDSLVIPTGSNLRYQTFGMTPNRYMVFEWNQVSTSSTAAKISFEAILYETTNQIRFVYGSTGPTTGSASVGIQSALSVGAPALSCTTSSAGSCGTANFPANQSIDFFLPPDLSVSSVTGDQTGYAGVSYRATALLKNVGGRVANSVVVRFYLSSNATYESSDAVIGEATVASIAAGIEMLVTASASIPAGTTPGPFFVIARADPDDLIMEQSETNNQGTPTQMSVGVATADLVVSSATGPMTGAPGATIPVKVVLANSGNAAAGAFKYTWFLSDNSVVTISDLKLNPIGTVGSLAQQMTDTKDDMVTLPTSLTAGQYWLGVCVNYDPGATPEFGIPEITQVNNCATATPPILISTGQVAVITNSLPQATQYSPYGLRLRAAGGNGTYSWAQTGGTLPPGIALAANGDLQGTPATAGTFAFDVKVSSNGADATASLSLMVSTGSLPLAVVDQDLPAAEFSRAYNADLVAVGGKPPYLWALKPDNRLPIGLALSLEGQIEGRASEGGDFLFGVTCTDSAGTVSSKDLKIKVVNPATLHIATAGLPTGYLKQSYLQVLQAVGGKPGYDWTLVRFQQLAENVTEQDGPVLGNGKDPIPFPATLGLKIEDGGNGSDYLRGTPKMSGLFLLTLKVVDSSLMAGEDYTQLLLRISYVEGLAITTTALPDAFISQTYQARLAHNGGKDAVVAFSVPCVKQATSAGMFTCAAVDPKQLVPPGLVLEANGTVAGTPTGEPGTYAFLVKVSDESGRQDVRSLSIKVRPDYKLEKTGGCSGTGLDPAMLAILVAAGLALRRPGRRS